MSERAFQRLVIELAKTLGWACAHFRSVAVRHKDGTVRYQTPVQADGEGWPDLVLVRPPVPGGAVPGRVLFCELKTDVGKLTPKQEAWLGLLRAAGAEAYCWRPKMWDLIVETLGG